MSSLLLFHNTDIPPVIWNKFDPYNGERPTFYWYSDRFASYQGTAKYLYFFLVNPEQDNVTLRVRGGNQDFDSMHRAHLEYVKEKTEEDMPFYSEPGIVMSFDKLKPALVLEACDTKRPKWLQMHYRQIYPSDSNSSFTLFQNAYNDLYEDRPIPFIDIPKIVSALPSIKEAFPISSPPLKQNRFTYSNWKEMQAPPGSWV